MYKTGKKVRSKKTGKVYDLMAERKTPISFPDVKSGTVESIAGDEVYYANGKKVWNHAPGIYLADDNEEFEED